jgi:tetratricopeptide (TPR) repeat protein
MEGKQICPGAPAPPRSLPNPGGATLVPLESTSKEEGIIMNIPKTLWSMPALILLATALALGLAPIVSGRAAGAAAQNFSRIDGEVRDLEGKPFPDVIVIIKFKETGQTWEVKTDKNGRFTHMAIRNGWYVFTFKVKDQVVYEEERRLATGEEARVYVNFKEIAAKQGAAAAEARKKQTEEKQKFDTMKAHFDNGRAALDQATQVKGDLQRTPADQRAPLQAKLNDLYQTAISELQDAEKSAPPQDPNLHVVMANLGVAYDSAGRYEEAAAALEKAIALKPTEANYYSILAKAQAHAGKIQQAGATCEKNASFDPATAAGCWRDFGITLYNAGRMKEAVEPLRKATALDPKYADAWYWLGNCLSNMMESKSEGDKIIAIVPPGTAEAFQKYLELAPNGRYAEPAKANLQQLEALGVGITAKVKTKKK